MYTRDEAHIGRGDHYLYTAYEAYIGRGDHYLYTTYEAYMGRGDHYLYTRGSVLGAILFLIYSGDLQRLIEENILRPHQYADDSQIYGSCRPEMQTHIAACIDDVA